MPHKLNKDRTVVFLSLVWFEMTGPISAAIHGEVDLVSGIDAAINLARGACV